jgi:hypothetical protein
MVKNEKKIMLLYGKIVYLIAKNSRRSVNVCEHTANKFDAHRYETIPRNI